MFNGTLYSTYRVMRCKDCAHSEVQDGRHFCLSHVQVSSRVASLMSMSGGLGVNISPLVVGQVIEEQPMVLVYLQVLVTAFSIIIFTVATWIGRDSLAAEKERTKLSRKKNEEEAMTEEEVKIPLKVVDPK